MVLAVPSAEVRSTSREVARTPAGSPWVTWSGYSMLLSRFLVRWAISMGAQARQHDESSVPGAWHLVNRTALA